MTFKGYSKTFTTKDNKQYELISKFWDEMLLKYNMEDLRGLGYNWTDSTIEYVIGLKNNNIIDINNINLKEIELPSEGWEIVNGNTNNLPEIYNDIYKISNLKYEIETFNNDGTCKIMFIRDK